jgi:hypothetical protein
MRYILVILLLAFGAPLFAQKADSAELVRCVGALNKALIKRDSIRLKFLLNNDLHYYHSNGWLQSKKEVIEDLYNGKLTYKAITSSGQAMHFLASDLAEVEMTINLEANLKGTPIHLDLDVIQSWGWKNDHWQLISRVSKKV